MPVLPCIGFAQKVRVAAQSSGQGYWASIITIQGGYFGTSLLRSTCPSCTQLRSGIWGQFGGECHREEHGAIRAVADADEYSFV